MIKYISIKLIMDDILAHPLLLDLSLERAINYTIHFILIVGSPIQFDEKVEIINILDYRGELPCDIYDIILVRTYEDNGHTPKVLRYSGDSFHMSNNKLFTPVNIGNIDLTYKILNSIIFTSFKEGIIEIAYHSIMLDKEGYPLIPENSSFIQALELYIKKQVFTILFDLGKISRDVLNNTLLEYSWYVGLAQRDLFMPTIDQMESISNMWCQLLQRNNEHSRAFRTAGSREYIKLH